MAEEKKEGQKAEEAPKEEKKAPQNQGGKEGQAPEGPTKRSHSGTLGASETELRKAKDEAQRLAKGLCLAEGCMEKINKYRFCTKHFQAYEYGLITKHGQPAKDYEKKLRALVAKKKIKVA
ncbi:hypothetical protein ACFLRA_02975 [Bdellovibrionota bacterium]